MLRGVSRHVDQESPDVLVARLTLRAEEVKERTARVGLLQALIGLATAAVTAGGVIVAALIAAGALAGGVVSCERAGSVGARHEEPAVSQQPAVPRKTSYAELGSHPIGPGTGPLRPSPLRPRICRGDAVTPSGVSDRACGSGRCLRNPCGVTGAPIRVGPMRISSRAATRRASLRDSRRVAVGRPPAAR